MTHSIAWIQCDNPGCEAGLVIDARHARNFDGRDWYCRDHNQQETRMTTATSTIKAPNITVNQGLELGDDLIRELAQHIGDEDALNAVFRRWADVLGTEWLPLVALAALRSTFAECLTVTAPDQVSAGATTYSNPKDAA